LVKKKLIRQGEYFQNWPWHCFLFFEPDHVSLPLLQQSQNNSDFY
jgi:hypothetical protein